MIAIKSNYWRLVALLAVIFAALFFRLYRLSDQPLGLFFDSAFNGLDSFRLMSRGGITPFVPTNGGRESLIIYLTIPFIWLFGTTPLAIRTPTAIASFVTVIWLFIFLYDTPIHKKQQNRQFWFAILGSLTLALSYWHITTGRLGVRATLTAFLSVPMFWLFLKGWRTGQTGYFLLSGLLMGLEGYTYFAARLLPVILVLALLPEFLPLHVNEKHKAHPPPTRKIFNFFLFVLAALVTYLPMAWYMINHPSQFAARASSVMVWNFLHTPADILAEMGRNLLRVGGFFCCAGSPNPIFGLPDYPALSPLLTPLLLISIIGTLQNWRNLFHRLIIIWWLVGIFPSIIAIESPHPLRMIVAVVPTAIMIAIAPFYIMDWLRPYLETSRPRRFKKPARSVSILWLTALLIIIPTPSIFKAYFIDWAELQSTHDIYDYKAVAIRDTVLEQAKTGTPIYLPLSRFNDPALLFYLSGSFKRQAVLTTSPSKTALLISPEKNQTDSTWIRLQNQTAFILPPLTNEGQQLIQTAFDTLTVNPIKTTNNETAALMVHLPDDPARFLQQPKQVITASFGSAILTGAAYQATLDPVADSLPVTLFWQASAQITAEYEIILHLVDDNRQTVGNGNAHPTDRVYPTRFWQPGIKIAAQHNITIEATPLAPGRYWLAVSVFNPVTGQLLPLTTGASDSPDTFYIGALKVPLPTPSPNLLATMDSQQVNFGDMAQLSGFVIEQQTVKAGESVNFLLLWQTLTPSVYDYTVFVHLLDSNNNIVAGNDTQPDKGSYPTSIWSTGEQIVDPHTLPVPTILPPGQYQIAIGLYHQPTGKRLPLIFANDSQNSDGRLILPQQITVK